MHGWVPRQSNKLSSCPEAIKTSCSAGMYHSDPLPPRSIFSWHHLNPSGAWRLFCSLFVSQVSIHVITNDRLTSLMRLVKSLQDSHFLGDEVQLSFHVDVDADRELMDYLMVSHYMTCHGTRCSCNCCFVGVENWSNLYQYGRVLRIFSENFPVVVRSQPHSPSGDLRHEEINKEREREMLHFWWSSTACVRG